MLGAWCVQSARRCSCLFAFLHICKYACSMCIPVQVSAQLLCWKCRLICVYLRLFVCWSKAKPTQRYCGSQLRSGIVSRHPTRSGTLRTNIPHPQPCLCLGCTLKCQSDYKQDKPPSHTCENTPAHKHLHWGDLWLCFLWHWLGFDGKLC